MNPIPSLRIAVVLSLATLACEARSTRPDVYATGDVELPSARDVDSDARDVASSSLRDAEREDAHDAAVADVQYAPCVEEINGGTCWYQGYGTTCEIACRVAPTCTFRLAVTWQGGNYCCLVSSDGPGRENFPFCNCIDGRVLCTTAAPGLVTQSPPTSYCEFCERDR